jgi:hypothetical protein
MCRLRNRYIRACIRGVMGAPESCRVLFAELLRGGIVITFSEGKSALFPAELLYESLPKAQNLEEEADEDLDRC